MMEMSAQTLPVVKTGNNMGLNCRPVGSTRRRARARELASAQLCMLFDFDTLESLTTLKPAPEKVDPERTVSTPRLRVVPVYNDSVEQPDDCRVHVLARTDFQCSYPTWSDDERDLAKHFACGAAKSRTATYCCSHMALAYGRKAA